MMCITMKNVCVSSIRLLLPMLLIVLLFGCTTPNGQKDDAPTPEVTITPEPSQSASTPDASEDFDSLPISEGSHNREEDYMLPFKTRLLSTPSFTLHMESRIFDETSLRVAARMLLSDLSELEKTAGAKPETVSVYLVESTPEGGPQLAGSGVFCTPDDFESGAYRDALAGAAYSLPAAWQRVGLAELAFGKESGVDLKDYYAGGENALTAACSAIHLSGVLSDAQTVSAARQTAKSLTEFALKNEGFAAFCEAAAPEPFLEPWAGSLGISPVPELPVGSADAAELAIKMKKDAICLLKIRNFTVTLSEDCWLTEPDGLYKWFCSFFAGMDMVLERIAADAPSSLALAQQRYAEPISIVFGDPNGVTFAYLTRGEIMLTKDNAIWHEMVHLLLAEKAFITEQEWLEEALAEHFCFAAQMRFAPTQYYSKGFDAYLAFFEEVSGKAAEEDDMLFHSRVWELYQSFRTQTETDDIEAYCRAYGIVSLACGGKLNRTQVRMLYDKSIAFKRGQKSGPKELDGSALTYPESVAMLEYMSELYGMDALVKAFVDGQSLAKTFGGSYSELYTAAIDHYTQKYSLEKPTA